MLTNGSGGWGGAKRVDGGVALRCARGGGVGDRELGGVERRRGLGGRCGEDDRGLSRCWVLALELRLGGGGMSSTRGPPDVVTVLTREHAETAGSVPRRDAF